MNLRWLLISFFALSLISPARINVWAVNGGLHHVDQAGLPTLHSISQTSARQLFLADSNDCLVAGTNEYQIMECNNNKENTFWQSGETWQVKEAISADFNRDGRNELAMVVWRPFRPWPIDVFLPHGGRIENFHDRKGQSCHIILVGWDGDEYRELWAGSSLIDPVFHIAAADLDADGYQELIAIEGKYDTPNRVGYLTIWDWSGFGFRLRDRSSRLVSDFGIVSNGKSVYIVSN